MTKISSGGGVFNSLATRRVAGSVSNSRFVALGVFSSVFALALITPTVFSTGSTSGNVQLDTEIATSIAMKIASPNDTNPDCTPESGVTYGTANRYASSTGDNSGKVVDTFDGREGQKDEVNTNTSCATLSMPPNTYDSTYSDVTVYTNSGTGYALSVRSADNTSPDLVNVTDSTLTIPAGALTEQDGTGEQAGQKIVPGGQNKWAIKTDENGILDTWTAVTSLDQILRAYDTETSGGSTTRVTYGISAGNNPTGKYATILTYTATMFDGDNPYVAKLGVTSDEYINVSADALSIPYRKSANLTVTPVSGYYLSSFTCPEGFTCTGINTGADYTGPQTLTITNEGSTNTGTLSFGGTIADPWASCGSSAGSTCTVAGVQYVRLKDGHLWTKNSRGTTTWNNLSSISCPSGTSKPTAAIFQTLVKAYDGYNDSDYGSPYGTYADSGALHNATGWSGCFWSTTEYYSNAWRMGVYSSSSSVYRGDLKSNSYQVVCYR